MSAKTFNGWLHERRAAARGRYYETDIAIRTCGEYVIGLRHDGIIGYEYNIFLADKLVAASFASLTRSFDEAARAAIFQSLEDGTVTRSNLELTNGEPIIRNWRAGQRR